MDRYGSTAVYGSTARRGTAAGCGCGAALGTGCMAGWGMRGERWGVVDCWKNECTHMHTHTHVPIHTYTHVPIHTHTPSTLKVYVDQITVVNNGGMDLPAGAHLTFPASTWVRRKIICDTASLHYTRFIPFIHPVLPYMHLCAPVIHVYTPYTHL